MQSSLKKITFASLVAGFAIGCAAPQQVEGSDVNGIAGTVIRAVRQHFTIPLVLEIINRVSGSGYESEQRYRNWEVKDASPGGWAGQDASDIDTDSIALRDNLALTQSVSRQRRAISLAIGDYNRDGKDDPVIVRAGNEYHFRNAGSLVFGDPGDVSFFADFNGDGHAELSVYRRSTSTFYSSSGWSRAYGNPGDIPYVCDFDGDGRLDLGVYRPSEAHFYIEGMGAIHWGEPGDYPIVGSFTDSSKCDIALYRPSTATFYVRGKWNNGKRYGEPGDIPVVGDYNGDGKSELAVYRPSEATFYIRGIADNGIFYGDPGDMPVPADYDGDGTTDVAVFRRNSGSWHIHGGDDFQFGDRNDLPGQVIK